jgi:hypothetical protein
MKDRVLSHGWGKEESVSKVTCAFDNVVWAKLAWARAYISTPKHVKRENAVLKSNEYETLALHVLVIT